MEILENKKSTSTDSFMKKSVTLKFDDKEFVINKCSLKTDILWASIIKKSQESSRLNKQYIDLGKQEISIEEKRKQAEILEQKLSDLQMENYNDEIFEVLKSICITNKIEFDKEWWLDNAELNEIIVFITTVYTKDVETKKKMAELFNSRLMHREQS